MFFCFFNGGPVYRVSLAVIYTATRGAGGFLYWPRADFKQSPMEREREPRAKEGKERKKKQSHKMNEQTETI